MADQPATQLDKAWIENFRKVDLQDFRDALKAITHDTKSDPVIPAMKTLTGEDTLPEGLPPGTPLPLTIGDLATDVKYVHGQTVNQEVVKMVKTLNGIIDSHITLFEDIDGALEETIETLFKTQGVSLDKVDGQKLMDIFEDEDVEVDLTTPPDEEEGGGGGDDTDKEK